MQRQDVRVGELRRDLDLAQKSLRADRHRHVGTQHLDSDEPLVLEVAGQEHPGHAAASQLAFHGVATGERCAEIVEGVEQGGPRGLYYRPLPGGASRARTP